MLAAGTVFDHFNELSDPRVNRGNNHSLYEMVIVALTAAICGANGWPDAMTGIWADWGFVEM